MRVGPFRFGAIVEPLIERFRLVEFYSPPPDADEFSIYTPSVDGGDYSIFVEDGRIEVVTCRRELLLGGQNLLRLPIDAITSLLGGPDKVSDFDHYAERWECSFDHVEAIVYGERGSRFPTSISVGPRIEED